MTRDVETEHKVFEMLMMITKLKKEIEELKSRLSDTETNVGHLWESVLGADKQ